MPAPAPDDRFERLATLQGACRVVGVDEVGRGPLCGPVTAAAIWLDPQHVPAGLQDSKRLTAKADLTFRRNWSGMPTFGIGHADPSEIDKHNILQATFLAMQRAIAALDVAPDRLLIDGNRLPKTCHVLARPWSGAMGAPFRSPLPRSWPRRRATR